MFTFAKDKQTARVAAEFYINAINVMKGAEAITEYTSFPRQEAFNIEYWLLEEAKLQRMPKPKAIKRENCIDNRKCRWYWKSIAKKFAEEGACVMINDINAERMKGAMEEFQKQFGKDIAASAMLDVTKEETIEKAFEEVCTGIWWC